MPLNSIAFLVCFAVFALVYHAARLRARRLLLLSGSFLFYGTFNPWYLAPLIGVSALAWGGARAIDSVHAPRRRRATTTAVVIATLGVLVAGKYLSAIAGALAELTGRALVAPPMLAKLELFGAAGVSFYTFSAVSYVMDVHRGLLAPERRLSLVVLYLAYFPKLLAGPIERATALLPRLALPMRVDEARVVSGLQQMLWGLFKKVVIADRLAVLVDRVYLQPQFASPADLVLATYAFAFQLYCDFSGYSDIAIGASRVLGLDLGENFRRPYLATSVAEFWSRRWHLSLATWFRDYVYIPLGGSRVALPLRIINVMAVFLLSGAWHGASWTFVVWGGLNGLFVTAALLRQRWIRAGSDPSRVLGATGACVRRLVTFHAILVTWVFFRAASLEDALTVLIRIGASAATLPQLVAARLQTGEWWLPLALVAVLLLVEWLDERRPVWDRLRARPLALRWAAYYAIGLALLVLGIWSRQQFVYMRF